MTVPITAGAIDLGTGAGSNAKNQKTAEAASQFEAILIAQMLKGMREEGSGWLGTGEDKAADSAMAMAEEHLASAISAAGGFGLSKVVNAGLQAPGVNGSIHHVAGSKGPGGHSR